MNSVPYRHAGGSYTPWPQNNPSTAAPSVPQLVANGQQRYMNSMPSFAAPGQRGMSSAVPVNQSSAVPVNQSMPPQSAPAASTVPTGQPMFAPPGAKQPKLKGLGVSADDRAATKLVREQILIPADKLNVEWEDIIGLKDVKQNLYEMVICPLMNPEVFCEIRSPAKGLLLFGPPGNGKTMLAKAVASQCKANFFYMPPAVFNSKYHGESEKIFAACFALANQLCEEEGKPSIIFIDEVDATMSSRGDGEHEVSRRIKTQAMQEMDGLLTTAENRVIVIGATNRPYDIDSACLRRFEKRLPVALPCSEDRAEIFKLYLRQAGTQPVNLSEADLRNAVTYTEDYSAFDLRCIVREAALAPLRDLPYDELCKLRKENIPAIEPTHFQQALIKTKTTYNEHDKAQMYKFQQDHCGL